MVPPEPDSDTCCARAIEIETLRRNEAQLRAIFDNAGVGVILVSKAGIVLNCNARFAQYLGYERAEIIGVHYHKLTAPEDIGIHAEKRDALWSGDVESVSAEKRWLTREGCRFWTRMTVSIQWNSLNGEPTTIGIIEDINEAKRSDESRKLLIGELNHRVKNTLAIVQGIVRQTLRNCRDPDRFAQIIEQRLQSISRAHDLLTRHNWEAITLEDLLQVTIADAFAAYRDAVTYHLSPARLNAQQSVTLSLIFHELMTNAIKHGALSVPDGRVICAAEIITEGALHRLDIRWVERGGPKPEPDTGDGFGSFLMERGVKFALNGSAEMNFLEDGLEARICFDVSAAHAGHDANGNYFQLVAKHPTPPPT